MIYCLTIITFCIDTAYVKHPIDQHWYDCDDSTITRIDDTNLEVIF